MNPPSPNPLRRAALLLFNLLAALCELSAAGPLRLAGEAMDLTFEAAPGAPAWNSFPGQVTFRQGETTVTVDLFWDGGRVWKARFAAPASGVWQWATASDVAGLGGQAGTVEFRAPTADEIAANANLRGRVRVAQPGARYFAYADGTPVPLIADTLWAINTARCGVASGALESYLRDRRAKGFNTLLFRYFNIGHRNEGGYAFPDNSLPGTPGGDANGESGRANGDGRFDGLNPAYWQSMDERMRLVWAHGFIGAAHPTWFTDLKISPADAALISRYLYARYAAFNIIWSLSGEYSKAQTFKVQPWDQPSLWSELGKQVQQWNQRAYRLPVSIHPTPWAPVFKPSSSYDFDAEVWLDHHWLQTGQGIRTLHKNPEVLLADYRLDPPRPLFHAEGWYENAPRVPGMYVASDYETRWQAWVAMLSGACGHGFANNLTYRVYDPTDPAGETGKYADEVGLAAGRTWREALQDPGAGQIGLMGNFLATLRWWALEPCRQTVEWRGPLPEPWVSVPMPTHTDLSPPHAARVAGETYLVYFPRGSAELRVRLTEITPGSYTADWLSPRDGSLTPFRQPAVSVGEDRIWQFPLTRPSTEDWVAVLQRARNP